MKKSVTLNLVIIILFFQIVFLQDSFTQKKPTPAEDFSSLTFTIASQVRISEIDDLTQFSNSECSGAGDLCDVDDVCVFSNTASGRYNVKADGDGSGGSFEVSDTINTLPYNLYWNDKSGTNNGQIQLTSNIVETGFRDADTMSVDCLGGSNLTARFFVEFLEADLVAAPASVYSGTVTLTIEPE
jgi:hypothetical protein